MKDMTRCNGQTIAVIESCKGREISGLEVTNSEVTLVFKDSTLRIWDDMQLCCESRYLVCDDDLKGFVGATFTGLSAREARDDETIRDDEWGKCHGVAFLLVQTSIGSFTVATHNEHSGYYSGFCLKVRLES